jgi:hypothetical protein
MRRRVEAILAILDNILNNTIYKCKAVGRLNSRPCSPPGSELAISGSCTARSHLAGVHKPDAPCMSRRGPPSQAMRFALADDLLEDEVHPDNPLNPMNRLNPDTPFAPLK